MALYAARGSSNTRLPSSACLSSARWRFVVHVVITGARRVPSTPTTAVTMAAVVAPMRATLAAGRRVHTRQVGERAASPLVRVRAEGGVRHADHRVVGVQGRHGQEAVVHADALRLGESVPS